MSDKFIVTNPWMHGNLKPVFKGDNPLEAANNAYENMSKFFGGNMKEFYFTLQKVKSKNDIASGKNSDYYHYMVSEKRGVKNNKAIKFNLQEINFNKDDNKLVTEFKKELKNTINDIKDRSKNKNGGGLFDDDDLFDEDESDEDMFLYDIYSYPKYRSLSRLYGWYYSPWLYNRFYRSNYYYVPTFAVGYNPYIYYIQRKINVPNQ